MAAHVPPDALTCQFDTFVKSCQVSDAAGMKGALSSLIHLGAEVNCSDSKGATLLSKVLKERKMSRRKVLAVRMLLESKADANLECSRGRQAATALQMAVILGERQVAEVLLSEGAADANIRRSLNGQMPLHTAVLQRNHEIVSLLTAGKADVNALWREKPPLHYACVKGNEQVMSALLRGGADPNHAWPNGMTPLHSTVALGEYEMAELMIRSRADVNKARTDDGMTPLHVAATHEGGSLVSLLIQNKADLHQQSLCGRKPLEHARSQTRPGSQQTFELLLKHAWHHKKHQPEFKQLWPETRGLRCASPPQRLATAPVLTIPEESCVVIENDV